MFKEFLKYEPETGIFTWIKETHPWIKHLGKQAGTVNEDGYIKIRLNRVGYSAHRLAWLFVYGSMPKLIDHINGNPADNRIVNLREATSKANANNRKRHRAGWLVGTSCKPNGRWRAFGYVKNKQKHLGTFGTMIEAHEAFRKWENEPKT